MTEFLITVDVGNSRVKIGLFDRVEHSAVHLHLPRCRHVSAVRVDEEIPWLQTLAQLPQAASIGGIIAGANPQGVKRVLATWPNDRAPHPRVLSNACEIPLTIRLQAPEKVGIDRLLNAVAANVIRAATRPAIIIDTGTATTVDVVAADGAFEGGAILPGFELAARALHQYTALLPLVSIEELAGLSRGPVGKDTGEALRSGLFWGQLGAVRELVERYTRILDTEPQLLLTGGGAELLAEHFPGARWDPALSLEGLALSAAAADVGQAPRA